MLQPAVLTTAAKLERLEACAHYVQKLADNWPINMTFEPWEARPVEAETEVVHKRQLMSLVRENRVGAEKWKLDRVRCAAADVRLVQVIRRQVQAERVGKLGINPRPFVFSLLEKVSD